MGIITPLIVIPQRPFRLLGFNSQFTCKNRSVSMTQLSFLPGFYKNSRFCLQSSGLKSTFSFIFHLLNRNVLTSFRDHFRTVSCCSVLAVWKSTEVLLAVRDCCLFITFFSACFTGVNYILSPSIKWLNSLSPSFSTIVYMMTFCLVLLNRSWVFKVVVMWFSSDLMFFLLLRHTLLNHRILTVGCSALFLVQKIDQLRTLPQKVFLGNLYLAWDFSLVCTFQVQSPLGPDK